VSKDYVVRLYRPGEEEAIVELLKTSYPEWRDADSPLDHWKWKYLENPHGSIFIVSDWNGKIVGVEGRIFLNIKIDEKTSSSYGDDGAVHPDYRRRGIYKNIVHYAEEQSIKSKTALNFAIQIHEASVIIMKNEGYDLFPFPIKHMLQIKDVKTHFKMRPTKNKVIARIGFSLLKLLNQLRNMVKSTEIQSNLKIEDIQEFDERINSFWEKIRDNYNFIIEKNVEYLNWRYCDPRSSIMGRYLVKQAVQDDEILGFIVLETREKDDYSEGYIVDLLALPDRMDVAGKLTAEALLFFRHLDINVVHYRVVKDHPYQALFSEQGFIEVPSKMHMSYKMFYEKEKMQIIKDSKPSQVHFNYGDYY
jgi:GNAT superfamily N-acetyltransferase